MTIFDYTIFATYLIVVLAVGFYHFRRNQSAEDYYIGSRSITSHHVGLSVVANDVGGGFSIGRGGTGLPNGVVRELVIVHRSGRRLDDGRADHSAHQSH